MSTFMEHIHRDTNTLMLYDDTARWRTVQSDPAPSQQGAPVGQVDARPPASETPEPAPGPGCAVPAGAA
jgi:hypothetical protein